MLSPDLRAFQLTEMHGLMVDPGVFQREYVEPAAQLMNARSIYHGVSATQAVTRVRNCMIRPETFVLVNCADSEDKLLKDVFESGIDILCGFFLQLTKTLIDQYS